MTRQRIAMAFLFASTVLLAVGFRFLLSGNTSPNAQSWMEPIQRLLLLVALGLNAVVFGLQRGVRPWPLLALVWILAQTLVIGSMTLLLAPGVGVAAPLQALLALALPWLFVGVKLPQASRRTFAFLIALLPVLSVAVGLVLQLAGIHDLYQGSFSGIIRLQGATKGDYFAALAFAGAAVSLHEWVRTRSGYFGALVCVDLVLLVFSGGRMALFATLVFVAIYLARSIAARRLFSRLRGRAYVGITAVVASVVLYAPILLHRMSGPGSDKLNLSGRRPIWEAYSKEFLESIWFGRGLGAGQEGIFDRAFPHDEYLRLLVEGGVVGAGLFLAAAVLWSWQLHRNLAVDDRPFLVAFMVAIAVYALTDNPLSSTYLSGFVYLGVLRNESLTPATPLFAPSPRSRPHP